MDKSKKILVIVCILIFGIILVFYFYSLAINSFGRGREAVARNLTRNSATVDRPKTAVNNEETPASVTAEKNKVIFDSSLIEGKNPKESYLIIRPMMQEIGSYSELVSFTDAFGSTYSKESVKKIGANGISSVISSIFSMMPDIDENLVSVESISDRQCVLTVSSSNRLGKAVMLYEQGLWKFDKEEWEK